MEKGPAALQQPYVRVVSLQEEAGEAHSRFAFTCVWLLCVATWVPV